MSEKIVYVGGSITGLTPSQAHSRFAYLTEGIEKLVNNVQCRSPMRCKPIDDEIKKYDRNGHIHFLGTWPKIFFRRDYNDVKSCDLLISDLSGVDKVSIGSVSEIAWAFQRQIPIIVISEDDGVHDHGFIREMATHYTPDHAEAISLAAYFLSDSDKSFTTWREDIGTWKSTKEEVIDGLMRR